MAESYFMFTGIVEELGAIISIDKTLAEPESEDDEYVYWPN